MPLRSFPFLLPYTTRPLQAKTFHTTNVLRDTGKQPNHYETLQIPTDASPSEVKKSFYTLSKTHHPDHNPSDPSASKRFVQISSAYHILSSPTSRATYDRDVLHLHLSRHSHSPIPKGSFHSSGPAGGRPASGLSRRKTQFRGPPPSFYRSGGWGEYSEKRKSAQDSDTTYTHNPFSSANSSYGGMGPGQTPLGNSSDVPHFDKEEHYRTHTNQDKRQRARRRKENGDPWNLGIGVSGSTSGTFSSFLLVGGIIAVGLWLPWVLVDSLIGGGGNGGRRNKSKAKREDTSG